MSRPLGLLHCGGSIIKVSHICKDRERNGSAILESDVSAARARCWSVQNDPVEDTDSEFVDARRAWGQDEVRPVQQAPRAILPREAERRAGFALSF